MGASYLFKPDDSLSEKVDVWLTWESTVLQVCIQNYSMMKTMYCIRSSPTVFHFQPALAASNFDKIADSPVLNLINHIDKALENDVYLVGVSNLSNSIGNLVS